MNVSVKQSAFVKAKCSPIRGYGWFSFSLWTQNWKSFTDADYK